MAYVRGNFIPLATPFTDDGRALSEVRMVRQVRFWTERDAAGFYLCGETGEFCAVGPSERKAMLEIILRECASSVPILVNVSSLSTALSLDLAQHAGRHGAAAAFITPPYFGRFTPKEIINHLRAVVGLAGIPVVIGDPFGAMKEGFGDAFDTMPKVEFAKGSSFDEWETEDASVHAIRVLAEFFPDSPHATLGAAYLTHGPAALVKAAFEHQGIELGTPRSPKAPLDGRELSELLQLAA
ncbi:MAG TPA: dihydrodipicolinate synthase family protein [Fimbriimonadaceae bacterium]|nr:dihydrodipicolinate synthase family protein [Fimbriimonadaceae bacterium]